MPDQVFLSSKPAFATLLPNFPSPEDLPTPLRRILKTSILENYEISSFGPPGDTIEGRYVLNDLANSELLFLKVFPRFLLPLQIHSESVGFFLSNKGLSTITSIDPSPFKLNGDFFGLRFPFYDSRFSDLSPLDLYKIGDILGLAHNLLGEFPEWAKVKNSGEALTRRLQESARLTFESNELASEFGDLVQKAAKDFLSRKWAIFNNPQVVHGDCNYTNFLFSKRSQTLFLIDFEETLNSWLNPLFDISMVLQRFVLQAKIEQRIELALSLFQGYAKTVKIRNCGQIDFHSMLKEITYRSVLILNEKQISGIPLPNSEWRKFSYLADQIDRDFDFLAQVSNCFEDIIRI